MAKKIVDGKQITICDGCGQEILPEGIVAEGYVSPDSPEYREVSIGGILGKENVSRQVCKNCYRLDFAKVYPQQECPI